MLPRTAYVHIPFCGHHCGYCDFAVTAGQDHLADVYLDALELELTRLTEPRPVESLFVGGGTPTHLSGDQLVRLFAILARWFPIDRAAPEVSVESTPESITPEKIDALTGGGVTRVSIGVQSFQPRLLRSLDRQHSVEHIGRAAELVRGAGFDLSLDLIYAAPGETVEEWESDLATALSFGPRHLSCYGLTYETGTPLWKAARKGNVAVVPEDAELEMYRLAAERLRAAGFGRYEVSNFALPGHESRHNRRYWANDGYYAAGVGAARYVNFERAVNRRDTRGYIRCVLGGDDPTQSRETLAPVERAYETLAVQLRRAEGVLRAPFEAQTGFDFDALVGSRLPHLLELGLLRDDGEGGDGVSLTDAGCELADGVVADLLKCAP